MPIKINFFKYNPNKSTQFSPEIKETADDITIPTIHLKIQNRLTVLCHLATTMNDINPNQLLTDTQTSDTSKQMRVQNTIQFKKS